MNLIAHNKNSFDYTVWLYLCAIGFELSGTYNICNKMIKENYARNSALLDSTQYFTTHAQFGGLDECQKTD
jgi:hypothetical protein